MPRKTTHTPESIDGAIRKNLAKLHKPGVLTVRPGYEIANHQLTGKHAIVAMVHTKKADLAKNDMLPNAISNIPVDVREASAYQRLRAHDPAAAELARAYGRPEDKEPEWPFEREMPSGKLLSDPQSKMQLALAKSKTHQALTHSALTAHSTKPQIPYVPAPHTSLVPVQTTTTITACVSPDAGLATLQNFLAGTQRSLVVGMYDFTSGRILEAFQKNLVNPKTLQMVLDNPAPNPTRDQTDVQTVQDLDKSLGGRASIVRALVKTDVFATAWIFPYAYHIKVIVRDGSSFWLSSGNLNNSNEPDLTAPPQTEDRDWHVIIEDPGLAKTFAAYLDQDYASAKAHQATAPSALAEAVSDAHAKLATEANPSPPPPLRRAQGGTVAAKAFSNISIKITPLLTPDALPNDPTKGQYLTNILSLINSATKKLYIQLQYIEASSGTGDYDTLLQAIQAKARAGVDVRLIESLQFGEKWAEKMKSAGVDLTANIRLQSNVHNKGFVVDSQTVVVSSQNFSPAGIRENRDAGVLIESQQIAAYYEPIFLADWNNKAKPFDPKAAAQMQKPSPPTQKTPNGDRTRAPTPESSVAEQIVRVALESFSAKHPEVLLESEAEAAILHRANAHKNYFQEEISSGNGSVDQFAGQLVQFMDELAAGAVLSASAQEGSAGELFSYGSVASILRKVGPKIRISVHNVREALKECRSFPWC